MEIPEFFEAKKYAEGCTALADELIRRFLAKEIDRVDVIYSHYKLSLIHISGVLYLLGRSFSYLTL